MAETDEAAFMRRAFEIAEAAMAEPGGSAYAAVLVRDGMIVGEGGSCPPDLFDPTAHAEIIALRDAAAKLRTLDLGDCELFSTAEPCAMCAAALWWARVRKVTYAAGRPDFLAGGLDLDQLDAHLASPSPPHRRLMRAEGSELFAAWRARPWYGDQARKWTPEPPEGA